MYLKVIRLNEVTSTNDYAYRLAQSGQKEIVCVTARTQTKGRGRRGREWVSASDKGVYASFILRPGVGFKEVNVLNILFALAVVKSLENIVSLKIKWPNDIVIGGKKMGGVLLESYSGTKGPLFVVAGLGLNVNSNVKDIPEGATSLFLETGQEYKIEEIFKCIVKEAIMLYKSFKKGDYEVIINDAEGYMDTLGREVSLDTGRGKFKGIAYKMGKYGALYVKSREGEIKKVLVSEIVHCR